MRVGEGRWQRDERDECGMGRERDAISDLDNSVMNASRAGFWRDEEGAGRKCRSGEVAKGVEGSEEGQAAGGGATESRRVDSG